MLSLGILVANSSTNDWEAVFVVSKAVLIHARPLGSTSRLYSLWRTSRRVKNGRVVHNSCADFYTGPDGLSAIRSNPTTLPKQDVLAWYLGAKCSRKVCR